jgi:hypothetical protein
MGVARTILAMALGIVLPLLVQLWDRRGFDPDQRDRMWNVATWATALYAFGPLSMLGWCWVTGSRWARAVRGAMWAGLVSLVIAGVDFGLGRMAGGPASAEDVEDFVDTLLVTGIALAVVAAVLLGIEAVLALVARLWPPPSAGIAPPCALSSPSPSSPSPET